MEVDALEGYTYIDMPERDDLTFEEAASPQKLVAKLCQLYVGQRHKTVRVDIYGGGGETHLSSSKSRLLITLGNRSRTRAALVAGTHHHDHHEEEFSPSLAATNEEQEQIKVKVGTDDNDDNMRQTAVAAATIAVPGEDHNDHDQDSCAGTPSEGQDHLPLLSHDVAKQKSSLENAPTKQESSKEARPKSGGNTDVDEQSGCLPEEVQSCSRGVNCGDDTDRDSDTETTADVGGRNTGSSR